MAKFGFTLLDDALASAKTEVWRSTHNKPNAYGDWVGAELLGTYDTLSKAKRAIAQFKRQRSGCFLVQHGDRLASTPIL